MISESSGVGSYIDEYIKCSYIALISGSARILSEGVDFSAKLVNIETNFEIQIHRIAPYLK